MAVFIDIRKKMGTVIVIVIGLSLGVFVLETALNSNSNLLQGTRDVVGVIDGNKIHYNDFNAKVDEVTIAYKLSTNQKSVDDNTLFSLREQAWNQMIQDHINEREFSAIGVTVPDEEFRDLFYGTDPYPAVRTAFTDPATGQFNPLAVKNYVNQLNTQTQEGEDLVEKQTRWFNFEKGVREDRLNTKYKTLLKGGMYIPKWQAEMDYNDRETKFDISYVKIPYSLVSDSAVKATDAEMQAFINKHKESYKQEEGRKIDYVIFTVNPSADDTAKASKYVQESYQHLVDNAADTNFIKLNADNGMDKFYYNKDKVSSQKGKDTLFSMAVGGVIPTYLEDGAFKTVKLVDRKVMPDSSRISLIYILKNQDSTKAKAKIDSLYNVAKGGSDFAQLAMQFSDDKQSGAKGGDQGYLKQGLNNKELNDFLFFGGVMGDLRVINAGNAYMLVKITEAPPPVPAVQYVIISRKVEASTNTDKMVFEVANKFYSANNTSEKFSKKYAETDPTLNKQTSDAVRKNDFQLPGLTTARDIVKWAYTAQKDEVSNVFRLEQNYVVARLVDIKPEGTMQLTPELKPQIEAEVKKEKKGAIIAGEINASRSLNATIESIAALTGQEVKTANGVSFGSPYINNLGAEPKLAGTVSTMQPNQVSNAIVGANGVFVIMVSNVSKATPIADYAQFKQQELQSITPRVEYGLIEALKKTIKVEDERYKFF